MYVRKNKQTTKKKTNYVNMNISMSFKTVLKGKMDVNAAMHFYHFPKLDPDTIETTLKIILT